VVGRTTSVTEVGLSWEWTSFNNMAARNRRGIPFYASLRKDHESP